MKKCTDLPYTPDLESKYLPFYFVLLFLLQSSIVNWKAIYLTFSLYKLNSSFAVTKSRRQKQDIFDDNMEKDSHTKNHIDEVSISVKVSFCFSYGWLQIRHQAGSEAKD